MCTTVIAESSEAIRKGRRSRFKRIVISERNYLALKRQGYAGDSFNDVISKLLRIEMSYQEMKKKQQEEEQQQQENNDNSSGLHCLTDPSATFEEQNKQRMAELVQLLRGKRRGKCSMNNQKNEQKIQEQEM